MSADLPGVSAANCECPSKCSSKTTRQNRSRGPLGNGTLPSILGLNLLAYLLVTTAYLLRRRREPIEIQSYCPD